MILSAGKGDIIAIFLIARTSHGMQGEHAPVHRHGADATHAVIDLAPGECVGDLESPAFSPCGTWAAVRVTFMLDCAAPILLVCHADTGLLACRVSCGGAADYVWGPR